MLLWSSPLWRTREKWIGTLIVPGGLAGSVYLGLFSALVGNYTCSSGTGMVETCTGAPSTAVRVLAVAGLVILLLAPIGTAIYLARRAR